MGEASNVPVIAIDGPSGSGKGTVASRLAQRLGFHCLDSGAFYRLTALAARDGGVDMEDEKSVARLAAGLDVRFVPGPENEPNRVFLDGRAVNAALYTETCGNDASLVARLPAVRSALLGRQRAFRQPPGLVADGRDMGTVVFADAELKIFLTASPEERARRRHKQLIAKGMGVNLAALVGEIKTRDARDRSRAIAPLIAADDAVVVDTTSHDIDAVFARLMEIVAARGLEDRCR